MEFQIHKSARKETVSRTEIQQRLLNWPDSYYREREPEVRLAMLMEADRQGLTPKDNEIRRKIFEKRYPNYRKGKFEQADLYLKAWIEMRFQAENGSGFFAKKHRREALKALRDFGYFDAQNEGERHLIYQEIYHLGLLYISLCQEDKGYNSILFGFGQISDEKLIRKIGNEFYTVAVTAPTKNQIVEECRMWTEALTAAYSDMFPDYAGILAE